MIKQGLEKLKRRTVDSKELDIILSNQLFPPIFSLFLKHFSVGEDSFYTNLFEAKKESYSLVSTLMFNNDMVCNEEYHATIDHVFSYSRLIKEYEKFTNKVEKWNQKGFVQVGLIFWGDVLLIGIEENVKDEVWRWGNGLINTQFCKLDDNIFDFFSRLKSTLDVETLEELKITPNNLYRNWGEEFWRVRGEDENHS